MENPYKNKKTGKIHQPVDSILIFPKRRNEGVYIPLVITRKNREEQSTHVKTVDAPPIAEVAIKKKTSAKKKAPAYGRKQTIYKFFSNH